MPTRVAILGAGRMGRVHAQALAPLRSVELAIVADPVDTASSSFAADFGVEIATPEQIMADDSIDAVIIASSTDTHADYLLMSLKAGKAVFCEKPLDLSIERSIDCLNAAKASDSPVMMGFNRRFDPNFSHLKTQLDAGAIGKPELLAITSFDPSPPPIEYIKVSGGLFRDMMIHDFDIACWIMGELPVSVNAQGSCLVDPAIGEAGDIDTAAVTLTFADGRIANILNSRRAAYGYDQRIEILGSEGALQAGNVIENSVTLATAQGMSSAKPMEFFLERYIDAYRFELRAFANALEDNTAPPTSVRDGVNALLLANCAETSMKESRKVDLLEVQNSLGLL